MEDVFNKLQKDNKNNADNLISWMKQSQIVDNNKDAEDKAKALFGEEQQNVGLSKFKEVVGKLAAEKKKTLEEVTAMLAEKGPDMLKNAFSSAASAFKGALGQ